MLAPMTRACCLSEHFCERFCFISVVDNSTQDLLSTVKDTSNKHKDSE